MGRGGKEEGFSLSPLTLDISLLFDGILTQEAYHFSFALAKDRFMVLDPVFAGSHLLCSPPPVTTHQGR